MKLSVEGGAYGWPNGREVLRHVNLSVHTGQIVAVLGPNGVGKTTLLRCVLGLLRWNSGRTTIDGKNVTELMARQLWQKVAYVPQARHSVFAVTVEEMVLLGRSVHVGLMNRPSEADRQIALQSLERVGMAHRRHSRCDQLSGGEFQMVLIARALCAEPELLVLDEPESSLDFRNQLMVLQMMKQLASEGLACLFNTHYPAHALRWAHRALLLHSDGQSAFGAVDEIMTSQKLQKLFGVKVALGRLSAERGNAAWVVPLELDELSERKE